MNVAKLLSFALIAVSGLMLYIMGDPFSPVQSIPASAYLFVAVFLLLGMFGLAYEVEYGSRSARITEDPIGLVLFGLLTGAFMFVNMFALVFWLAGELSLNYAMTTIVFTLAMSGLVVISEKSHPTLLRT